MVNKQMPRTFGDGLIHISHIDYAVKADQPLFTHGGRPPSDVEAKIGKIIAENLVDNGATLQMGTNALNSIRLDFGFVKFSQLHF